VAERDETQWHLESAMYRKVDKGHEMLVESNGEEWSASVRRFVPGHHSAVLVCEVHGLSARSVAQSVVVDLLDLATSIREGDTAKGQEKIAEGLGR
jgi:hypothetical protein